MFLSIDELRKLGFSRTFKLFNSKVDLFEIIKSANHITSACKVTPFSLTRYASIIESLDQREVGGILSLFSVTEYGQRKFRDTWNRIWDKFGEACDLTPNDVSMLKTSSIRIPFIIAAMELGNTDAMRLVQFNESFYKALDIDKTSSTQRGILFDTVECVRVICKLTNIVIGWFMTTEYESTEEDILAYLALSDFDTFASNFEQGRRVWFTKQDTSVNHTGESSLSGISNKRVRKG